MADGHLCQCTDGHLRKGGSGHLRNVCGNTCNECDPPLPDTLYVTLADLGGDYAAYNGTTAVEWVSGCYWRDHEAFIRLEVFYDAVTGYWYVELQHADHPTARKHWRTADERYVPCDPDRTYVETTCTGTAYFTDPDTCTLSAGATASVSTEAP
jgi:hypothetical protein